MLREEYRLWVFENRVIRRIFRPKRDEVIWEWRKLHNEELHILYSSPNIIRQIKSRKMRWAGHVSHMGEERKVHRVWWESPKWRDHLEDWRIDGRIWWEWVLGRLVWTGGVEWTQLAQDRGRPSSCKYSDGSGAMELVSWYNTSIDAVFSAVLKHCVFNFLINFIIQFPGFHAFDKLSKFQNIWGARTLKKKTRKETNLKFYKIMAVPV
jgi:hypothetical protein